MSTEILVNASTVPTKGTASVTFQNAQGKKGFAIEIYGTATSANVNFKCTSASGTERVLSGVRISDFGVGTTGNMNEIWQFDGTGLYSFIAEVTAVSGGNVTVAGSW